MGVLASTHVCKLVCRLGYNPSTLLTLQSFATYSPVRIHPVHPLEALPLKLMPGTFLTLLHPPPSDSPSQL